MKAVLFALVLNSLLFGLLEIGDFVILRHDHCGPEQHRCELIGNAPAVAGEIRVGNLAPHLKKRLVTRDGERVAMFKVEARANVQPLLAGGETYSGVDSKYLHHPRDIPRWGLAAVLQLYDYFNLNALTADKRNFGFDPRALNRDVGAQLAPSGVREALVRRVRSVQGLLQQQDAGDRHTQGERRYYEHQKGPLGHVPLGLKIALLAPFIPLGLWICWRFLDASDYRHGLLGVALSGLGMLFGAGVFAAALVLMVL